MRTTRLNRQAAFVRQRLTVRRVALAAVSSFVVMAFVAGSIVLWARLSATLALERALRAVADGRPVPSEIDLRLVGMEVALDDEAKLRALLRKGFEIKSGHYYWEAFPRRAFGYAVGVSVDIDMVCEVNADDRWKIFCGQVKCMVSPCEIHLSSGLTAILDSSAPDSVSGVIRESVPPDTSLERARDR